MQCDNLKTTSREHTGQHRQSGGGGPDEDDDDDDDVGVYKLLNSSFLLLQSMAGAFLAARF